jgi:hypothetical protein
MPAACPSEPHHKAHPRPWRRDSVFVPPRVRRLSAPALRAWCGFVHACRRTRVPTADGRRHVAALTGDRLGVAMQLLQFVGWRGQERVAIEALAGAAATSVDTVGRALEFLEGVGLIRRHHMIRRTAGGPTTQDITFYELREPPAPDPQSAADRGPYGLILSFLAGRRARHMAAAIQRTIRKALGKGSGPSSGSDEWARWNAERQIAALRGG